MYYTFVLNTGGPTSTEFWYDIYDNMTTSQCIPVEAVLLFWTKFVISRYKNVCQCPEGIMIAACMTCVPSKLRKAKTRMVI